MEFCPVCDADLAALGVLTCPHCKKRYEAEMNMKPPRIPQRFVDAGEDFTFDDWLSLAEIELRYRSSPKAGQRAFEVEVARLLQQHEVERAVKLSPRQAEQERQKSIDTMRRQHRLY